MVAGRPHPLPTLCQRRVRHSDFRDSDSRDPPASAAGRHSCSASAATVHGGQTIRAWGFGTGARGEELAGGSARWYLDDRQAALGFDVFLKAPEPGEHRLTLVVEDAGAKADSAVVFVTLAQAAPSET